jgi:ubiquinone/menaquinone biosynthesis C-methylase UbiE
MNPFKRRAFDYGIYEKSFQVHDHEKGPWTIIVKEVEALNHLYKTISDGMKKLMILTLATGPGELPLSLAKALPEAQVYATDINVRMVELASNKAQELKLNNMTSLTLDMEDMSQFEDQSFDMVTCCYGLAHADDIYKALNEIHRYVALFTVSDNK